MEKSKALKVLIVSTGRAGSGYIAKTLSLSGYPCGHEAIFNNPDEAIVRSQYEDNTNFAESSWLAAPFIGAHWLKDDVKIVHLVRHPLAVARSFYEINFFSWKRADRRFNRIVYENTAINRFTQRRQSSAVKHYFYWNKLIESKLDAAKNPRFLLRLEDLLAEDSSAQAELEAFLELQFDHLGERVNSKAEEKRDQQGRAFSEWRARRQIKKLALSHNTYGYEL